MKITAVRLKEIIKEEVSKKLSEASMEDLEARLAGIDTRRGEDTQKVKHRIARDNLNEIARTLQLMSDLQNAIVRKKSKYFSDRSTTIYRLPVQEMPALLELADITKEYAKHVKGEELEPMNERSDH